MMLLKVKRIKESMKIFQNKIMMIIFDTMFLWTIIFIARLLPKNYFLLHIMYCFFVCLKI